MPRLVVPDPGIFCRKRRAMQKRILVLSVDAMVCEDLEKLLELPNGRKYLAGGCKAQEGMRTIYPSVTYPAHVSMLTGCYAGTHGVTSNFIFTTKDKEQSWRWDGGYTVDDIFHAAKRAGYTTGSVSWPATANHPDVDWLMAEYWMPKEGDTLRSSFADAGSSPAMIDIIEANAKYLPEGYEKGGRRNFMKWPEEDDFVIHVASQVIREHAPEVMFAHIGMFDSFRHASGVFGPHIDKAIDALDRYLGELMEACRIAGVAENTNLVLVSDHGQQNICRVLNLNVLLADAGLLQINENGEIEDWKAVSFSNAMSSLIYLKDPKDEKLKEHVHEILKSMCEEGIYGIGRVFTEQEADREEHLKGDFSFVVESDGYTSFADRAVRPLVSDFGERDYRFGRATHGYLPDHGPQPVFAAKGPDFRDDFILKRGRIVDEAPTYAKLLGVTLRDADGTAMEELLEPGDIRHEDLSGTARRD